MTPPSRHTTRVAAATAASALVALALTAPTASLGTPASATDAAAPRAARPGCPPPPPSGVTGQLFPYTAADAGEPQYFTAPSGITALGVTAVGGFGGATKNTGDGGWGALVTATVPVTPGQCLSVYPGGYGGATGGIGFLNGGDHGTIGHAAEGYSGGGGGAMSVVYLAYNSIVVAGGGGGAGGNGSGGGIRNYGGAGGNAGADGQAGAAGGEWGGSGGCGGCLNAQSGGNGRNADNFGGGGGGGGSGWSGGDGGGSDGNTGVGGGGGGGGGSSVVPANATNVEIATATESNCSANDTPPACNGWVALQWGSAVATEPPATQALITGKRASVDTRGRVGVKVACTSPAKCTGRLLLHAGHRDRTWHRVAARHYAVPPGETRTMRVAANPGAATVRRLLATVTNEPRGPHSGQVMHRRVLPLRTSHQ